MRTECGLTVFELIISLVIFMILSSIAVPQLSDLSASYDRMNVRSTLLQDLKRAQAESLTKGCRGIFSVASDGKSYSFGCDYLSYDTNVPPSADEVSYMRVLPKKTTLSTNAQVIFNSRGQCVDAYDVLQTVTVTLSSNAGEDDEVIATGTIMATGLFSFN